MQGDGPALRIEQAASEPGWALDILRLGVIHRLAIIDPDREWKFERSQTASKSTNSPFYGWQLKGKAVGTIVNGRMIWSDLAH